MIEVPQVEYVERIIEVPQTRSVERIIEVPEVIYQEVVRHVPRVEVREVERFVHRPVVEPVERMVDVPEVRYVERIVEVPEVILQEVVRHVPRRIVEEVVRRVPRVETQIVEKIIEVPEVRTVEKIVEVPQIRFEDVIVPVPKIEIREVIKNVPKYETQIVERVVEVPQTEYRETRVEVTRPPPASAGPPFASLNVQTFGQQGLGGMRQVPSPLPLSIANPAWQSVNPALRTQSRSPSPMFRNVGGSYTAQPPRSGSRSPVPSPRGSVRALAGTVTMPAPIPSWPSGQVPRPIWGGPSVNVSSPFLGGVAPLPFNGASVQVPRAFPGAQMLPSRTGWPMSAAANVPLQRFGYPPSPVPANAIALNISPPGSLVPPDSAQPTMPDKGKAATAATAQTSDNGRSASADQAPALPYPAMGSVNSLGYTPIGSRSDLTSRSPSGPAPPAAEVIMATSANVPEPAARVATEPPPSIGPSTYLDAEPSQSHFCRESLRKTLSNPFAPLMSTTLTESAPTAAMDAEAVELPARGISAENMISSVDAADRIGSVVVVDDAPSPMDGAVIHERMRHPLSSSSTSPAVLASSSGTLPAATSIAADLSDPFVLIPSASAAHTQPATSIEFAAPGATEPPPNDQPPTKKAIITEPAAKRRSRPTSEKQAPSPKSGKLTPSGKAAIARAKAAVAGSQATSPKKSAAAEQATTPKKSTAAERRKNAP